MARYDRIARLDSPHRDHALTGWQAVRELEQDERDAALGRRARLRFLTVRAVYRFARQTEDDTPSHASLTAQVDAVREELGQLPSRDPEREGLADLLKTASSLDAPATARGALSMADAYQRAGDRYVAEEFAHAGLALARAGGEPGLEEDARALLGRLRDGD